LRGLLLLRGGRGKEEKGVIEEIGEGRGTKGGEGREGMPAQLGAS